MQALHFGAGKIGRGFIGAQLVKSGYKLLFADVNQPLIDQLNAQGGYRVHIAEKEPKYEDICGIEAAHIDSERVIEQIISADIITTAVSMRVLPAVVPTIVRGLIARAASANSSSVNIICCENGVRATSQLKALLFAELDQHMRQWCDRYVGFADSAVDRIVPEIETGSGVDVAVERYFEWCIDATTIIGEQPPILGVTYTDNLDACIERKLFTLNTAHCATAYLGALRGYKYIHEAICDPAVRSVVVRLAEQSSQALIAKFGLDRQSQVRYISTILHRFENDSLRDTVARVARDPKRKLSAPLYFAYPATLAIKYALATDAFEEVVAAALCFRSADDPQSQEIAKYIARSGVRSTVEQLTGINFPPFLDGVESNYGKMQ